MSEDKLKIFSTHGNLRLCIIENCIVIEETISYVLGTILNIEWKESKSFGFGSTSLSFNQKVQIILDIKGLDKEVLKKMMTLMNIRNKFAHLSEIKAFDDLFTKLSVGKEVKKNFDKWYIDPKDVINIQQHNREKIYRVCFYLLINDVTDILMNIAGEHAYDAGFADGRKEFNEKLNKELLEIISSVDGGKERINRILEKMKIELKK